MHNLEMDEPRNKQRRKLPSLRHVTKRRGSDKTTDWGHAGAIKQIDE